MTSKKRVLLISPLPFTLTNRGMDLFTHAFEESGWETHHLQFPNVFYSLQKTALFTTQVIELKARKILIPYVDSIMKKIPGFVFRWIVKNHQRSVSFIDWHQYDVVVLESGKPLFLLDLIPKSTCLVYRQSDSVREILGKKPDYIALEDRIIRYGHHLVVVKKRFGKLIPKEYQSKVRVIQNGFSIWKTDEAKNPYEEGSVNAVYAGLIDLDWACVQKMCHSNPDIQFHFFGNGLKRIPRFRIRKIKNLVDHGFVPTSFYMPYVIYANLYTFPFNRNEMRNVGLTSKFYVAMHYRLPIVTYHIEPKSEFDGLPVDFCDNPEEFAETVKKIAAEKPKRDYSLPWDELKHQACKEKYKKFIDELAGKDK